jgi:hypothetical protein
MAADDDEMENEACVGGLCFLQPHSGYFPPPFYRRIPGREHRWKAGARLRTGPGLQLKIQRAIALPNCLGLGDDARWRWQWIPLSLQTGMKIEGLLQHSQQKVAADNSPCQNESLYMQSIRTFPFARIKVLSPIFGKLGMYENSCLKTCGQLSLSLLLSLSQGQGGSHFSILISESRIVSFFLYPLRLAGPSQVQGGRA